MNADIIILVVEVIIWLTLIFLAAFLEMADSALSGLKAREIFESNQGNRKIVNLWLRRGADIRLALAIWKTIFIGLAVLSAVIWSLHATYALNFVLKITILLFIVILTSLLGNFLPRLLVADASDKSIFKFVKIANLWTVGTHYFNISVAAVINLIAWLLGMRSGMKIFESETDDSALSEMVEKDAPLEKEEHEMIKSIFEFGDTVVREVMVPRTEMEAIPVSCSLDDAIEKALEEGHSRLPVYEKNVDCIIGVFYLRDALKYWKNRGNNQLPELRKIIHKPFCVPETKKVNELLKEFKAAKIQLAIIIDEYGGTAGLATLEDLVEEIVGEIHDEFDVDEEEQYEQIDENTFLIDAGILVDDVNDDLGIHLPEEEDFDTVGGYVMYELGHMPKEGETISNKEFVIKIIKVTDRRVEKIQLTRLAEKIEKKEKK
ncbi:MAG: hypothetical protein DRI44_02145 [Chlamydiae bacterium]|nr:MAG: hypothetical protein DRI44_02145 [Chlamydiota bacterium]